MKKAYDEYQFLTVYNTIHNFFTIEMSSFYLDIAKDTLYIEHADHPNRRAIQTVLYQTAVALTKLLSPIIPHTAEEVWQFVPGEKEEYVQLSDMPEVKNFEGTADLEEKWDHVMELRDEVLKALEEARNEKKIGKSLTAQLHIYADNGTKDLLEGVANLEKLFIVSGATVAGTKAEAPAEAKVYEELAISVSPAEGETCERCWQVKKDVGANSEYPTLCASCAETVKNHY